jgi:N-acetyl sugar amidotransferase
LKHSHRVASTSRQYQICSRCVMDTTAPSLRFNDLGQCSSCQNFDNAIAPNWHTDERGSARLQQMAALIRKESGGKSFDCIIGISGGLDSSYAAYTAVEKMGLRPLLFHVDAGWNTDQAVSNIEKLVDGLGLDLYTEVINWEEMKDLQRAFLYSQIADQDLPQDYAFFSSLYQFARKYRIKYVITGSNYSTECCREPVAWGGFLGVDRMLVSDIHKKFGTIPLVTFPLVDIYKYKVLYKYALGMKVLMPLNHTPFVKTIAEAELRQLFGWQPFQHKHHESRFTRFYEDFWLPRKFGFDKRRAHFSSLILTSQMNRADALRRLERPEMSESFIQNEFEYVANKLDLTVVELQEIFDGENRTFNDYRNKQRFVLAPAKIMHALGLDRRLFQ